MQQLGACTAQLVSVQMNALLHLDWKLSPASLISEHFAATKYFVLQNLKLESNTKTNSTMASPYQETKRKLPDPPLCDSHLLTIFHSLA